MRNRTTQEQWAHEECDESPVLWECPECGEIVNWEVDGEECPLHGTPGPSDLVERVKRAIEGNFDWTLDDDTIQIHFTNASAQAAIREVADWCEERFDSHGINTMPNFLRSQLEDSEALKGGDK